MCRSLSDPCIDEPGGACVSSQQSAVSSQQSAVSNRLSTVDNHQLGVNTTLPRGCASPSKSFPGRCCSVSLPSGQLPRPTNRPTERRSTPPSTSQPPPSRPWHCQADQCQTRRAVHLPGHAMAHGCHVVKVCLRAGQVHPVDHALDPLPPLVARVLHTRQLHTFVNPACACMGYLAAQVRPALQSARTSSARWRARCIRPWR